METRVPGRGKKQKRAASLSSIDPLANRTRSTGRGVAEAERMPSRRRFPEEPVADSSAAGRER
jgi:hypothetical protein